MTSGITSPKYGLARVNWAKTEKPDETIASIEVESDGACQ
jgi:hypothetical protein